MIEKPPLPGRPFAASFMRASVTFSAGTSHGAMLQPCTECRSGPAIASPAPRRRPPDCRTAGCRWAPATRARLPTPTATAAATPTSSSNGFTPEAMPPACPGRPGRISAHVGLVILQIGMFMISWYALTRRLRTSTVARKATEAFCDSSITCESSTPGTPRSNLRRQVGGAGLRLVDAVQSLLQHIGETGRRRALRCARRTRPGNRAGFATCGAPTFACDCRARICARTLSICMLLMVSSWFSQAAGTSTPAERSCASL